MVKHGQAWTYRTGRCRCGLCKAAHTERMRREVASRRERLAADPTVVTHGLASTYNNWGCRCDACTAAVGEKLREYRNRQS